MAQVWSLPVYEAFKIMNLRGNQIIIILYLGDSDNYVAEFG
jgi:hypothetical protein